MDAAAPVNPWRRRGLRLLVAIAVLAFATFVPLVPCSTCDGTGQKKVETTDASGHECYQCSGRGRRTLLEVVWPLWGA